MYFVKLNGPTSYYNASDSDTAESLGCLKAASVMFVFVVFVCLGSRLDSRLSSEALWICSVSSAKGTSRTLLASCGALLCLALLLKQLSTNARWLMLALLLKQLSTNAHWLT